MASFTPRSALALAGLLAAVCVVGAAGYALSAPALLHWYPALHKPPLTPPGWVFGPVWTALYLAMAVAAWLAWRTRPSSCRTAGLRLWWVQLAINLGWTAVFFGMRSPGVALIDIALLLVAVARILPPFRTIRPPAAALMGVYLLWLCFAAYLNAGIWLLNR